MRIVFLGFGTYGHASLLGLIQDDEIVVDLVISHPPTRNDKDSHKVIELARSVGIHTLQSKCLSERCIKENIETLKPDAIVSTNWRKRIPSDVFSVGRLGTLNIHDALLPDYGGLSAEQWVILNDEKKTGVTVHFVTDEMDAGPIVHQIEFDICEHDTAEKIAAKQLDIYPHIICEALKKIKPNSFRPQLYDICKYSRYHALSSIDAKLCFEQTPKEIDCQIRAWSGKFGNCWIENQAGKFSIRSVQISPIALRGIPGRVVTHSQEGVWVVTGKCPQSGRSGIIIKDLIAQDGDLVDARKIIGRRTHL